MTEQEFRAYRDAVIQADRERGQQAYWLAHCELGPMPDWETRYAEYLVYIRALNRLAAVKMAQLN